MFKLGASVILCFTFLSIENQLVMLLRGYHHNLVFSSFHSLFAVLVINYFLAFSILHSIETALPDLFGSADRDEDF
ncbi:MAG TPA: hypothetical protein VJ824_11575 [Bacillota bacterium]|nr:hypothetical protein [Bacillota bacterium]